MKFRAKMNVAYVRQFHNVLATMARLSKICVVKLDQDYIYFITNESGVSGSSVWCQLDGKNFFEEYVLEGVTEDAPYIFLEIQPGQMAQSLALLKTSKDSIQLVKVKLTRKHHQACLSFQIEMPYDRQCVHDVPGMCFFQYGHSTKETFLQNILGEIGYLKILSTIVYILHLYSYIFYF